MGDRIQLRNYFLFSLIINILIYIYKYSIFLFLFLKKIINKYILDINKNWNFEFQNDF